MKIKKAVIWWLVNEKLHESLAAGDRTIEALMPLVSALFPGIDYYSGTGFHQVMRTCVMPALKKQYPELLTTPATGISPEATTEIAVALPSNGYEWQDNEWQDKFRQLLAA